MIAWNTGHSEQYQKTGGFAHPFWSWDHSCALHYTGQSQAAFLLHNIGYENMKSHWSWIDRFGKGMNLLMGLFCMQRKGL